MKKSTLVCSIVAGILSLSAVGQNDNLERVSKQLQSVYPELRSSDVQNLNVDASHVSKPSGINYVYLNQTANGIRIKNSSINAAFDQENKLVNLTGNPIDNVLSRAESSEPSLSLNQAIEGTIAKLGIQGSVSVEQLEGFKYSLVIDAGNYLHETKAELVYWFTAEEELKLVWNFNVDLPDETHWYDFMISAQTGEEVERIDWQVSCTHSGAHSEKADGCSHFEEEASSSVKRTTLDGSVYNVFPFPVESPNHGNRALLTQPAVSTASPFGWHDTNGNPGAEFTNTRGNNVYAYEDASDTNQPGQSAEGGEDLNFDFSLNISNNPDTYRDAAITNLFYANNVIHDILYANGFDEASGNFQDNNYGNGGFSGDEVRAEAQDGGGLNNANMATPGDGSNPRMQMYLWNTGVASGSFIANSPASIASAYPSSAPSTFGPGFPAAGLTGNLTLVVDADNPINNGCSEITNPGEISGNVAFIYRGGCSFVEKVALAQEAGAIAVIIINNVLGEDPFTPGGTSTEITIPSLMVSFDVAETFLDALAEGQEVNVTLEDSDSSILKDGSFDNGIVVHEYIHGLSNRLTGGANNSGCLSGDEQMGEGWSDYYAIMMTMDLSADNPVFRPMGTFANGDPIDGNGIRPVPYDTSFAVNAFTYASVPSQNVSIPHGVGFVWCTMLWDMTWDLIDVYGFDADLINGTAGNNIAMLLVTEGLKLQPCGPGFVDGRDAILLADQLLYDGANQCLIWNAFAKRGLGFSADQGSSQSRTDGTAAFDTPAICQEVFTAPTAAFSVSAETSCTGIVEFFDESEDVPQSWFWEFGDGNTSDEQNPLHLYEEQGFYTVSLTVTNTLGEDEAIEANLINFSVPSEPEADGVSGCAGDIVELTTSSPDGNEVRWLNSELDQVGLGNNLEITIGAENETYFVQNFSELPLIDFVGPLDNDFGTGGNHGSAYVGTIIFEVFEPITIESALVISGATGSRSIRLIEGLNNDGSTLQTIVVDVDFTGSGRIDLGFEINEPGIYSMGLNNAEFYRNDMGANYPYEIDDVMTIIGSPAGPEFYYYFYDVEVSTRGCVSDLVEVVAEVTGEATFSFEENDLSISFTDESPEASSWSWNFGDGNVSTEQNPTHTYAALGVYDVTLTVDDGCSMTMNIPVGTTSTDDIGAARGFSVYPNPASGMVFLDNLEFGSDRLTLRLHDMTGKEVLNKDFMGERSELNLAGLNSGLYFISVSERGANSILFRDKLTIAE
ncbi:MAG: PKD repeat protein [Cryomorphaceae bacterium]|jgi:PKD repeat protein